MMDQKFKVSMVLTHDQMLNLATIILKGEVKSSGLRVIGHDLIEHSGTEFTTNYLVVEKTP